MSYRGDYKNRLRHGNGTYLFPPNDYFKYSGQWVKGRMHGEGIFMMKDGSSYEGTFERGEITGRGLRRWPDGTTYSGQFVEGELCGDGIYISYKGENYEGQWKDNKRHGLGQLKYSNKDYYEGSFENNLRHGEGIMRYNDERHYSGEWKKGVFHGRGVYILPNGEQYDGNWENGKRSGHGFGLIASIEYLGNWVNDMPAKIPDVIIAQICGANIEEIDTSTIKLSLTTPESFNVSPGNETPSIMAYFGKFMEEDTVSNVEENDDPPEILQYALPVVEESGRSMRLSLRSGTPPDNNEEANVPDCSDGTNSLPSVNFYLKKEADTTVAKEEDEKPVGDDSKEDNREGHLTDYFEVTEAIEISRNGKAMFTGIRMPIELELGNYYFVFESCHQLNYLNDQEIRGFYLPFSVTA